MYASTLSTAGLKLGAFSSFERCPKKTLEKGEYLQGRNALSFIGRYGPAQGGEAGGE